MSKLYLTTEEQELFNQLPSAVTQQWEDMVETEYLENLETVDQLVVRLELLAEKYPEFWDVIERYRGTLEQGEEITDFDLFDEMPEEFISDFFFSIGCEGISLYIHAGLNESDDINMDVIVALAEYRHRLVNANSISYV